MRWTWMVVAVLLACGGERREPIDGAAVCDRLIGLAGNGASVATRDECVANNAYFERTLEADGVQSIYRCMLGARSTDAAARCVPESVRGELPAVTRETERVEHARAVEQVTLELEAAARELEASKDPASLEAAKLKFDALKRKLDELSLTRPR